MVDELGHLGMALLWLAPTWYFVDRRKTAAAVVLTGFWFGTLPDVDLYLSRWLADVHHHGVVHTVLAVTVMTLVLGPLYGWALSVVGRGRDWLSAAAARRAPALGVVVVWVAAMSHLFADSLSAPDISQPIEPLWPLSGSSVLSVDVFWYKSVWATWGLLALGVAANVAAWYWRRASDETRRRVASTE